MLVAVFVALGGQAASRGDGGGVGDCAPQTSWGTDQTAVEAQVIALVNAHRTAMGLNALTPAPSLVASAEWKSMNMAGYQYMAHDDPAPVARTISDRFATCGYPTSAAWGENIAYGFVDAQSVMSAWLSDTGHKANIENSSWTTIGVGVAQASNGLIFWTQDFGTVGAPTQPPPAHDTTPPTVPSAVTAVAQSGTSMSVSWHASTDDNGVAGYDVYLNGAKLGTTGVETSTIGGLQCGTTYTIGVDAYDGSGNKSAVATTSAATQSCTPTGGDTQAPAIPTGLGASNVTQTAANVSWSASSDNVGVAGYTVYVNGSSTATFTGLNGALSGLTCGTTYAVGVDAFDAAGNHSLPSNISVTTDDCTTNDQPPTVPDDVTATPNSRQAITITWTQSTDDQRVVGYTVYLNGTAYKTTGQFATSVKVKGLDCGTAYTLGVDAFDAAGNHSAAATATASTNACANGQSQ